MARVNQLDKGNWNRPASNSLVDEIGVDEKYKLMEILDRKLRNIPDGVIPRPRQRGSGIQPSKDDLTITDVMDHEAKAVNLPHIPPDIRLAFLLKHRATIDEQGRLAIKDPEAQHIDITRAIFFWRLDDMHQFQRYHDNARWNIALFIAILSDERFGSKEAQPARDFAIAYLAAVLEHHNDPATFDKREAFVKLWKDSKYDLFTFTASQKNAMKRVSKRLNKEWEDELFRIKNGGDFEGSMEETGPAYYVKVSKFVGTLVPGRPAHCRPPAVVIEDLKKKNVADNYTMQNKALLEALNVRGEDYYVSETTSAKPAKQGAPSSVPVHTILGFQEPSAEYLQAQHPASIRAPNDYPALHFPKVSRFDVNKNAETIMDKSAAFSVLRKVKPNAILRDLVKIFPEEVPNPEKDPMVDAFATRAPASGSPQLDHDTMDVDDSLLSTGAIWGFSAESRTKTGPSLFGGSSLIGSAK